MSAIEHPIPCLHALLHLTLSAGARAARRYRQDDGRFPSAHGAEC